MIWDVSDEHKVCYKDKNTLKNINYLTDLFDDAIHYIYETYDHSEFFIDVFYTETEDVGTGIYEQLMKYLNIFVGEEYKQRFVEKYSNDRCKCKMICSDNIKVLLKKAFNLQYGEKSVLDEKSDLLLNIIADKISDYIGTCDAQYYKLSKIPNVFNEFYPHLVFTESCIRCGNYTFLIMYGTTD